MEQKDLLIFAIGKKRTDPGLDRHHQNSPAPCGWPSIALGSQGDAWLIAVDAEELLLFDFALFINQVAADSDLDEANRLAYRLKGVVIAIEGAKEADKSLLAQIIGISRFKHSRVHRQGSAAKGPDLRAVDDIDSLKRVTAAAAEAPEEFATEPLIAAFLLQVDVGLLLAAVT
jgi:hypothetical protein